METKSVFAGEGVSKLFMEFVKQLHSESDRGAVIVAAAILEEGLEKVLKKRMLKGSRKKDELFDGSYAPIGNLSAKIELCYRLGLIRAKVKKSFHLIRKIRNIFAHNMQQISFETESILTHVKALFKNEKDIVDAILIDINSTTPQLNLPQPITDMIDTLGARYSFDLLAASTMMAVHRLPLLIERLPPLE